jgi:uncharacterized membrane protein (UPF0127 family)
VESVRPERFTAGAALAVVAVAGVAVVACGSSSPDAEGTVSVTIDDAVVRAEVAESPADREQGLSGRARLEEGRGMLFVYHDHAERTYWMKGMRFPIDIVWIDRGRVTGLERDVPVPQGDVPLYRSRGPADHVLEVPAGWAGRHGVERGDPVTVDR